jgi:hypothetical protein
MPRLRMRGGIPLLAIYAVTAFSESDNMGIRKEKYQNEGQNSMGFVNFTRQTILLRHQVHAE